MSGALFSRIKNWGSTDTLTASDLNAEFDNILTNFKPQMMDAYSANVSQMQVQTNPGAVGTESLATSLSGELERLRFQLAAITGNSYWYSSPAASLSTLNTALGANTQSNSVTSGRALSTSSQPVYLVPSGSTNSLTVKGTTTPLVYKIAGTSYTLSADTTISSLTTAPSTNNTVTINDANLSGQTFSKLLGENGSDVTVSGMGSSVSSLVGQLAAFKTAGSEYVLCRVESTTKLSHCFRGYFFQSNDTLFSRTTVTTGDTWTLMKLTWVYIGTTGAITVVYTNPRVSGTAPTSPSTGDYWYDTVNNIWKTYNSTTWVAANTTLLGVCIQDTTKTIGARSLDFFKNYADLNSIELFAETTLQIRSRNPGSQLSVYGTTLTFTADFLQWNTSANMDSGQTFTASTVYYMYVKETGDTIISDIAPFDRRGDLRGYYHPLNTWRCVGYAFANASTQFNVTAPNSEVESFFRTDDSRPVSTMTAAVSNYPLPYVVPFKQELIRCDGSSAGFTQVIPPPSQWKGRRLIYSRTDNTLANTVTLQAWGATVQSTTANTTAGNATLSSVAASAGIVTGNLISGYGIPPGTTVSSGGGTATITASASSLYTATGATVTFTNSTGINGVFTLPLNTQYESYELYSDGINITILSHNIPSVAIPWTPTNTQGFGTLASGFFTWQRIGNAALLIGRFVAGTVAASEAQIGLPSGMTTSSKYVTTSAAGCMFSPSVSVNGASVLVQASRTYINFGVQSASFGGLTPVNGNGSWANGIGLGFMAIIEVDGWGG